MGNLLIREIAFWTTRAKSTSSPSKGAESYTLHCSGTVDDHAEISISGGGSCSSDGSGAGVPIDGDITVSSPGYHQITAKHENADYPPDANISYIHCTVGPAEAVIIEPEKNDPPEECTANAEPAFAKARIRLPAGRRHRRVPRLPAEVLPLRPDFPAAFRVRRAAAASRARPRPRA